jgi:hypothetical protein
MVGGYGADYLCAACIYDDGIGAFISENAASETCSFCGAASDEPIAAPLSEVVDYMQQCISRHYDDPANWLSYDGAEGGYQGKTFSTDDLLVGSIGLELPTDSNGQLYRAISYGLKNYLWCENNPYSLNPIERLNFSWDHFCEVIKHMRRYFFLGERREDGELFNPAEVLDCIFSFVESANLFVQLRSGTRFFRARYQPDGERYSTALELGPPPTDRNDVCI